MASRQLHPREEPYRWAIEKFDEVFGQDQVRVMPRNHYHIIRVIASSTAGRAELVLRDPMFDLNKQENRESFLADWIAKAKKRLARPRAA
jgi:hypothetical protein